MIFQTMFLIIGLLDLLGFALIASVKEENILTNKNVNITTNHAKNSLKKVS